MSRVIDAVLRLKDEFTGPMSSAVNMMTSASKAGEKARKALDNTGKSMQKLGKQLTATVTLPIVGLGAASYKTFESVDKQLNLVKATMGESAYATADLSQALQDAAVQSIFSMEDGASALAVELEHMAMLDVLVDAVEIVDGPGIFGRGVEHVDAEGEIGFRIMEHAEHGGQDVDLLGNLVLDGGLQVGNPRLVYNNR